MNSRVRRMTVQKMVELKAITEDSFIDAFKLKLASGRKNTFRIRYGVLHRRTFTGISTSPSAIQAESP